MAEKQVVYPFRRGTRQHYDFVNTVDFTISGAVNNQQLAPVRIPRVGMLAGIWIEVIATLTTTNAVVLTSRFHNWLKRVSVRINNGALNLYDSDGFNLFLTQARLSQGYEMDTAMRTATPYSLVYAVPVANGANTWRLLYYLPISLNNTVNFETGLINLQATNTEVTLEMTTGALADIVTVPGDVTSLAGQIKVHYRYYEIPANQRMYQLPPPLVVRRIQTEQPILTSSR